MVATIEKIADFMDISLSPSQLEVIVEKSSFVWMKAHESQFCPLMLPGWGDRARPAMMRSGQAGGSSELLSAEQQAAIDQYFKARLKYLKSDFPYGEIFALMSKG
jgi:hypothetical protein